MRQFLKFTLASFTGFLLVFLVIFLIFSALVAGLMSKDDKVTEIKKNSILHLDFADVIADRGTENPLSGIDFTSLEGSQTTSFRDYTRSIHAAAEDDKILGIFLDLSDIQTDMAIRQEIRNALKDFKKSGKFIYAYSETYTQSSYHLASLADSIFLYPEGDLMFMGYASEPMFFKGMLDKLGIEVKLIRVGKYKSAGEPFIRENLSEENRFQVSSYINSLYTNFLNDVSEGRNIPADSLRAIANDLRVENARMAVEQKLVDKLAYIDEIHDLLMAKADVKKLKDLNLVSVSDYMRAVPKGSISEKNRIAVVYAIGDITSGEGDDATIGSDRIAGALRDARLDENVKAVVLRVNSPGGSALASDVIWREMTLLKKKKPLVVSMGGLAASGGYYIAIAADTIYAEPTTITGSIGVFGLIPNISPFMKNKLGLTFDRVTTGKYADLGTATRAMTPEEEAIIQRLVNNIYDDFTTKVAKNRKLSLDSVQAMAQGRVYTGSQALEIGLVDRLGNLDDAIATAARMAKLDKYRLKELPEMKNPIDELLSELTGMQARNLEQEIGLPLRQWKTVKGILENDRIQARMEFLPAVQ